MAYIGNSPANIGNYGVVDDISASFNGTLTSFALTANSLAINPAKSGQLLVSINGVLQEPDDTGTDGFKVSGSNIVFSSAPATSSTFWAVWQGNAVDIGTPSDATVGTAQLSATGTKSSTTYLAGDNTWKTVDTDPTMGGDLSGTASNAQIVANAVGTTEIANSAVTDAKISGMSSSKLSGALPAIDGSSLTGIEGVPSGIISMWSGAAAAIPSGWFLCDGTNGTPNLIGKFIKGATAAGGTGGSGTTSSTGSHSHSHTLSAGNHTLSTAQMPSHVHRCVGTNQPPSSSDLDAIVNPGSWNRWVTNPDSGTSDNRLGKPKSHGTEGGGSSHSHSLSGSISSGGSHTHTIEPVYFALCYIMKS